MRCIRAGADFDGNRWNDLHYTNGEKGAARSRSQSTPAPELFSDSRSSQMFPGE